MPSETNEKRFRIAFSFAGEKREFVEATAQILAQKFGEKKILYDKFHEAEFARFDLGMYLPKLYGEQSELIVPVLCGKYDQKRWTGWEWMHIYGLLTKADGHRVMPSRFDYAHADGLSPAAGFIELDYKTPEQFAALILQRLAINEGKANNHYTNNLKLDPSVIEQTSLAPTLCFHDELTVKKLSAKEVESFFRSIRKLLPQCFPNCPKFQNSTEVVHFFNDSTRDQEEIEQLFSIVRDALREQSQTEYKKAAEEVAALLYCIAARQLVDAVTIKANMDRLGAEVLLVPYDQNLICAVIVTALFGGTLLLKAPDPSDIPSLPRAEWVLDTDELPNGDNLTGSLECAAFNALFKNSKLTPELCLDSKGLNSQQKALLLNRIKDLKRRKLSLALVLRGTPHLNVVVSVSQKFQ